MSEPTPAPARFPYAEHRTVAEVDRDILAERRRMMLERMHKGTIGRVVVPPSERIR